MPILYGIDGTDAMEDESTWPKANPGMAFGQPDLKSLRRSWNTMKRSPAGRGEFSRYHCARADENTGGWLDMALWPSVAAVERDSLRGRAAWCGLDLSQVTRHDGAWSWRCRSTMAASTWKATTGGRVRMSRNASWTTGCRSANGERTDY
jgi:phage terminase large subunit-like protein